jgi:translation initiation factor 2D
VQVPADASAGTLVGIAQVARDAQGPPLAVGRMAVDADKIDNGVTKGKAVIVLHTWKDHLWAIGRKGDPPEAVLVTATGAEAAAGGDQKNGVVDGSNEGADMPPPSRGQEPGEHPPAEAQGGPVAGPVPVTEEKLTPEGNVPNVHRTFTSSL